MHRVNCRNFQGVQNLVWGKHVLGIHMNIQILKRFGIHMSFGGLWNLGTGNSCITVSDIAASVQLSRIIRLQHMVKHKKIA